MNYAQMRQVEYTNNSRLPAPRYDPGDMVWLSSRNFRTERPSRKLDHKFTGPYEILEAIGTHAYRLKFPRTIKRHPVVHVSEIEPAAQDPLAGQIIPPPPPVIVEGNEEWEVEEVVDSRFRYRKLQYKVKWKGDDKTTWQPTDDLEHVPDLVHTFHQKYPNKPGPSLEL